MAEEVPMTNLEKHLKFLEVCYNKKLSDESRKTMTLDYVKNQAIVFAQTKPDAPNRNDMLRELGAVFKESEELLRGVAKTLFATVLFQSLTEHMIDVMVSELSDERIAIETALMDAAILGLRLAYRDTIREMTEKHPNQDWLVARGKLADGVIEYDQKS